MKQKLDVKTLKTIAGGTSHHGGSGGIAIGVGVGVSVGKSGGKGKGC